MFLLLTIEITTISRNMYTQNIIIYFNKIYCLSIVYNPFRRCHQVRYTHAKSEGSLTIFLRIDSKQHSPVSSLHFDFLHSTAKDFTENNYILIKIVLNI